METSLVNAWTIARLTLWDALRVAYYCVSAVLLCKPVVRAPRKYDLIADYRFGCIEVGLAFGVCRQKCREKAVSG
jgi:hypothetical protein